MDTLWHWLTTPPSASDVLDLFGAAYALVFFVGFATSAYFAGQTATSITRDPDVSAWMRHWARIGLGLFGSGLFFFAVRAFQINPASFGAPIWMVSSLVALGVTGSWFFASWQATQENL